MVKYAVPRENNCREIPNQPVLELNPIMKGLKLYALVDTSNLLLGSLRSPKERKIIGPRTSSVSFLPASRLGMASDSFSGPIDRRRYQISTRSGGVSLLPSTYSYFLRWLNRLALHTT